MNRVGTVDKKNILLLQGPVGFFFKKLDKQFRQKGATTHRIGLNAGDEFYSYKDNYTAYRGSQEKWMDFLLNYLKEKHIDKVFLFGDCRFYQNIAIQASLELAIEVFVFEEGYVRPDYITMERHGVNDYSHIARDPEFFRDLADSKITDPENAASNPISNWSIVMVYYFIARLFRFRYAEYKHHRDYSATQEFFFGTRSLIRKLLYSIPDKQYIAKITGKFKNKYYFVPLQTHNDFQILQHSGYGSIEKFIIEVLESFAKNADKSTSLMFKHHPIDRGRKNYKKFIYEQSDTLNIRDRIWVVHDLHLPTCLQNALGTVTINSTVGLSSLFHCTPTITLGNAIYDMDGLTSHGMSLDDFWKNNTVPDDQLFHKFRNYLIETTQLNGSFYGRFPVEFETDEMYS